MIKKWFSILPATSLLVLSCDPSRRIEMKNKTSDTAEITWKSQEDSIGFNPFVLNNAKELTFKLPPNKHSEMKFSFGLGTWSPQEVEKAIHWIEYFQIKTPKSSMRIDSLPMLRDYLLARRKGIGGSKIEIVVE
jgi:hypothetical protein